MELLEDSLVRAVPQVQGIDLGLQVVDRDLVLVLGAVRRVVVQLGLPHFVGQLLVRLLEVARLHLGLLQLHGTRGVVTHQRLILHDLLLRGLLQHLSSGLGVSHRLLASMRLRLFLCLIDFKLVLQLVQLVDYLVLLSVELLFGLSIGKLGVLPPFPLFTQSVGLQSRLIDLCSQVADLLGVLLCLDLAGLQLGLL